MERKAGKARTATLCRGDARSRRSGFSLLELIIVLVLLGLVAAVVTPSFTTGLTGLKLETSCRDVMTLMKHARSEAIGKQRVFRVVLGDENALSGRYMLTNDFGEAMSEFRLPDGFRFELEEGMPFPLVVSFYPNGRSSGAVFAVQAGERGRTIPVVVDPVTGFAKAATKPVEEH